MSAIKNALSALISLTLSSAYAASNTMPASSGLPAGMEKCYGIAKAGLNDCGNGVHQCAGEAKVNGDKSEWLAVPDGLCNKIVGGSLKPNAKS